jgi:hypothetical protein
VAKDGKGKKDKAKKAKVAKELGGTKVPKKLRKLGDQAVKLAKEPVVAEVVAGALLAAAAALREGKDPRGTVGAALKGGMKTAAGGGRKKSEGQADGGVRLSDSLKLMALDFARRALEPKADTRAKGDARQDAETAQPAQPAAPGEVPQAAEEPGVELPGGRGG